MAESLPIDLILRPVHCRQNENNLAKTEIDFWIEYFLLMLWGLQKVGQLTNTPSYDLSYSIPSIELYLENFSILPR